MKEDYKYYSDLSKEERKKLEKEVRKENKSISYWHSFIVGTAMMIGFSITIAYHGFGQKLIISDYLLVAIIAMPLSVVFYRAVVFPQIKEAIERKINSKQNS